MSSDIIQTRLEKQLLIKNELDNISPGILIQTSHGDAVFRKTTVKGFIAKLLSDNKVYSFSFRMFKKVKHSEALQNYRNGLKKANKLKGSTIITKEGKYIVGSVTRDKSRVALYNDDTYSHKVVLLEKFYKMVESH